MSHVSREFSRGDRAPTWFWRAWSARSQSTGPAASACRAGLVAAPQIISSDVGRAAVIGWPISRAAASRRRRASGRPRQRAGAGARRAASSSRRSLLSAAAATMSARRLVRDGVEVVAASSRGAETTTTAPLNGGRQIRAPIAAQFRFVNQLSARVANTMVPRRRRSKTSGPHPEGIRIFADGLFTVAIWCSPSDGRPVAQLRRDVELRRSAAAIRLRLQEAGGWPQDSGFLPRSSSPAGVAFIHTAGFTHSTARARRPVRQSRPQSSRRRSARSSPPKMVCRDPRSSLPSASRRPRTATFRRMLEDVSRRTAQAGEWTDRCDAEYAAPARRERRPRWCITAPGRAAAC